jgi:hypothetical protein
METLAWKEPDFIKPKKNLLLRIGFDKQFSGEQQTCSQYGCLARDRFQLRAFCTQRSWIPVAIDTRNQRIFRACSAVGKNVKKIVD